MNNAPGQAANCRVNFTNSFIAEVPLPESGRQIYWDTKERNLGLRVTPMGRTLFVRVRVSSTLKSKVFEHNLDEQKDIKEARNEAAERRIELRNGIDRAENKKLATKRMMEESEERRLQKLTLAAALEEYIVAREESKKPLSARTAADYRGMIDGMLAKVKDKPLEEFTREFCASLIGDISAEIVERSRKSIKASGDTTRNTRTGVRANYALRLVRLLCRTYGIGNQAWGKFKGFDFPWIEERAKRTGLDPEFGHGTAIWKALSTRRCDTGASFLMAVLLTGCRRNELSGLTAGQVSIPKAQITLEKTKNGEDHIVHMSDQLVDLIKPLLLDRKTGEGKAADDKVFPTTGDPRKLLKAVSAEIGEEFTCHSLRKYFAINCMDLGIAMPVIKACLNHSMAKSRDVTERHYAHAKPSQMRAAWQRHADTIVPTTAEIINLETRRSAA